MWGETFEETGAHTQKIKTEHSEIEALETHRRKHFLLKGNAAVCPVTSFVMAWISVPSVISIIATKVGTPKPTLERVPTQIIVGRAGKSRQLCLNCQVIL